MILQASVLGFWLLNARLPWQGRARVFLGDAGAFSVGLMLLWANDFRAVFWVAVIPGLLTAGAGVREFARDPEQRASIVRAILADPAYAGSFPNADKAAGLAIAAIFSDEKENVSATIRELPQVLEAVDQMGIRCKPMETSYFLGRETLIASRRKHGMAVWREQLFAVMSRNARAASSFFHLPPNRVVELGAQIEL